MYTRGEVNRLDHTHLLVITFCPSLVYDLSLSLSLSLSSLSRTHTNTLSKFAIIPPGVHIYPHTGPTNIILTAKMVPVHLPAPVHLRVGEESK